MQLTLRMFILLCFATLIQSEPLRGAHVVVGTVLDTPYFMLSEDPRTNLTGNDRFQGYVVDIFEAISKILDFKYEFKISNGYGAKDGTGKWNGMIGELIDGRAHVAAGALTITSEREAVCDFTLPFMNLGIGIIHKRDTSSTSIFDDFSGLFYPFTHYSTDIFLVLTLTLGITLLIIRRKYKSFYFRTVLGFCLLFLYIFTILFGAQVSVYYNQHAFVKTEYQTFSKVEDLVSQSQVMYGCVRGGSTCSFFRNSNSSKSGIYAKMWSRMESAPSSFVLNVQEGMERVKNGGYAFMTELPAIEYTMARDCNLYQVGGLLDSKGFGFAVQQGSSFREALNWAILVLQEQGTLMTMKSKWWSEKNGGGNC